MGSYFRRWRLSLAILSLGALVAVVPAAAVVPGFQAGDLVVSSNVYGSLQWLRADGSFVQPLDTGLSDVSGAEFDPSGRLWAVSYGLNKAVALDAEGNPLGTIVGEIADPSMPGGHPTDIAFDATGNAYIGAYEFEGPVTKFSPSGASLGVLADREADHLDLAADQCTLFMQHANNGQINFKDVCTDGPVGSVPYGGTGDEEYDLSESFGMRILPDGSLLVATPESSLASGGSGVIHMRLDGTVVRIYDTPDCAGGGWLGVALNQDATRFWSSCRVWPAAPIPVEFDVATGAVVRTLPITGIVQAVYGGFRAAQDRTAPTVSLVTPAQGADYKLGAQIPADYTCNDIGGSLLATCLGSVSVGQPIDTATVGNKTFQVTASDGAGNSASASASYHVSFDISPFQEPVDNLPTVNVMKAGKGVYVRFSVAGNQGLGIVASGYPLSRRATCPTGAPEDVVEQTTNARAGSWAVGGGSVSTSYSYAFRTYASQRRTCRELVLRFTDGTERTALFRLT